MSSIAFSTEPAIHLSKQNYYDNDFVSAESGALETRRWFKKEKGKESMFFSILYVERWTVKNNEIIPF